MMRQNRDFDSRPYLASGIFFAGFVLYALLLYPGFMSTDSVVQIMEGRDGVYSDWHPPAMALLWRWVDRVIAGPAGMLLIQTALLWGGMYLLNDAYFSRARSLRFAVALFALMFFPLILCIAGVIWKDVWMWAMLLLALACIGQARKHAAEKRQYKVFLVFAGACVLAALLVRHNAIFAAMPLILLGTQVKRPADSLKALAPKLMLTLFMGAMVFLAVGKINGELASRKTYPWIGNAAFDIAGVIVRMDDSTAQQALFDALSSSLGSHQPLSKLKADYTSAYWMTLFRGAPPALDFPPESLNGNKGFFGLPEQNRNDLKKLWLHTIVSHPALWVEHRTAVFVDVLGLDSANRWDVAVFDPNYYPDDRAGRYGRNPPASNLQKALQWRINALSKWFVSWPATYFLLLAVLMAYAMSRPEHRRSASIYIIVSGL